MKIQGKKILITGGSSGIGRALALLCARQGATVAIWGRTPNKVDDTLGELKKYSPHAVGVTADLGDETATQLAINNLLAQWGSVDILVNNAGYTVYRTFHESSLEELLHITKTNYLGTLTVTKMILDSMMKSKTQGFIVNVASVAASLPITPSAIYGISKHAQRALTDLLSYEYAPFGIKFSLVLPGRVDTPFFDHPSFARQNARIENKGMMTAEYVALKIQDAIEKEIHYVVVPYRFRLAIWLFRAFPWIFRPLIGRILRARIYDHYNHLGWPQDQSSSQA